MYIDQSGASEGALNLKNMLDGIVPRIEAAFAEYSVELPNRRYWTMGQPAIDCDQLVVYFIEAFLGTPGEEIGQPQRCYVPRSATIGISIAREVPTVGVNGRAPSPEKIQEYSGKSAIDAWVLLESARKFDMWDESGGYGPGVVVSLEVSPPEGGFQLVNMTLTMVIP
jgi:hypothetical protein